MAVIAGTNLLNVASFQFKEPEMPFACSNAIRKHFGDCPKRNVTLTKRKENSAILPKVRAQNDNSPCKNAFPITLSTNSHTQILLLILFFFFMLLALYFSLRLCSRFQVLQSGSDCQVIILFFYGAMRFTV